MTNATSGDDPAAVATRFYERFQARDGDGMAALYSDDATFSDPAFPDLRGAEVGRMWKMLTRRGRDLELTFEPPVAEGPWQRVAWTAKYTFSATGKHVTNHVVGRLRVERWAEPDPPEGTPDEHVFLVIGGVGVDAAMVADADEQLKARVGWIAYFVAAVRHLHGRRLRVRIKVDDREWTEVRGRSLLVGNVGRLPGGITLLPDARIDDGWLDLAALDARGGVAGWAQLLGEVMLQRIGVRNDLPAKIGRIDHVRARRVKVQIVGGEQVQVDGESVGRVKQLSAEVDPGALVVRVAPPRL